MPEDLRWNAATLWAGPKCHIVHYPLSGWKVFNLVVTYHTDAPEPVAGQPVPIETVRQGFGHVCARAQSIIEHGKDWKMWVLCDRDPTDQMPEDLRWNAATLWAGPKCHIVHYPLSGWKVFNLVVTYHTDAPKPVAGQPVPVETVRQGFGHVCARARSIIEHGTDWKMWVLCDRDPTDRWIDGRVALLGDAAHPMLQYMAQGACMAMEDAVCLADSLHRTESVEAGLRTYRDRRVLRTARVQLMSRAMGDQVYHPAGPHAALRNALMSAKSQPQWLDTMEWLYGGNGLD